MAQAVAMTIVIAAAMLVMGSCDRKPVMAHSAFTHLPNGGWQRTMPLSFRPEYDDSAARYDVTLAALFLGVTPQGFAGGRLDEYLDDEQKARIDEISREVYAALVKVQELTVERDVPQSLKPFDFLLELKRDPIVNY